ncbi:hypothetical protein ACPW96_19165 [Micromonospora sp. DT81.3]|uniref:hypothetical protein n=1 Tax=Micromonospora sp. DT81.3 TaxID=3416523 RepID=UPI003CF8F17E
MSGGEGFGPVGPAAAEGPPFAVAGPASVALDAGRSGSGSFTVSNMTGRPVRARVLVLPGAGADASWFQVVGESERAMPVAGTATVDVAVKVPEKVPAGAFSFVVGAALEEAPDQVVSGPTVAFQVPDPKKRRFPWWIVILAVVLILLVEGGIFVWRLLTSDPETTPSESPSAAPSPTHDVYGEYDFVAFNNLMFDVDEGERGDYYSDEYRIIDLLFVGNMEADGFLSVVGYDSRFLAFVDEGTFEACDAAAGYTQGETLRIPPEETSFLCVRFTDQERMALLTMDPANPASGTHDISAIVWERGAT